MHVNVGIGGDITVGISADTAAFAVQHLNGVAFADGQIARHRAAVALFKSEAGTFPVDVEDKGDGYEVKAYLTGVAKDDIDVELNEGRLSISVNVEEDEENEGKNFLQKEFSSYSATRGVYLKDASSEGLSAKYADGILTVTVPKIVEKKNVTKISID